MELNYTLEEADYLEFQLFNASKSDRVKKQRTKSWFFLTFAFLSLCFLFYMMHNKLMMYYFGAVSLVVLVFYPLFQKRYYYKHYQKHTADKYKNRFNEPNKIEFSENTIDCTDISGETKLNLSAIEEIVETNKYIYLKTKTGEYLIIPKLKLDNVEMVQSYLISLAGKLHISYKQELDWKWS